MRVLHIEGGKHLYGGPYQVLQLLRLLKGRGEHMLACPTDSAIAPEALKDGIDVIPIPLHGEASVAAYFALREIIRERKPDIVHIHSRRGADFWGVIAAKRAGVKLVITRRVDNPEARWLARFRYGPASRVVGISQKICDVLESEGVPREKLVCIRDGVDISTYAPHKGREYIAAQFGIAPDESVIVMAAQFIGRKGHATLIEAIPSILAKHPRARFLLLGQGPLWEEIRTRALAFGDRVLMPGFRDDVARILPECDILVHPAEMEGMGVVILQAAACGVPIVTTTAGGIPEVVVEGRSGFLIEPKNAVALADRVDRLVSNAELRKAMSQFARQYAEKELLVQSMADGNHAMYEKLSQS